LLKLSGYMLPEDERYNLYTLMINFANRNYRQGKMEYLRKMFDLYRQLIKEDLLFHGYDAMTDNLNFKNVVTIGLRLEEMDWTEDFIKKYRSKLDPASRDAIYYFSLANLHFFKAEYSKALKYLKRVEFIDSFLRLNYDMLLMKTYYECEETEALLSLCNSFNMFIRRNKALSETNKEAYLNMGRYVRKLIRYREKKLYQRQGMMQDLAALKPLVEINWLQSKAEELAPEED
jgi:tetratricopeptide (TPR) repeat protein